MTAPQPKRSGYDDPIERVIRPIVEGQIRSFIHDHPEVVGAVNWFKPSKDKAGTLVNSLSKRITRDLLCAETRVRLAAAALALGSGAADQEGAVKARDAASAAGVELNDARPRLSC